MKQPTAYEKLQWALHPRRSSLELGERVADPFQNGTRPGLGMCLTTKVTLHGCPSCCCQDALFPNRSEGDK